MTGVLSPYLFLAQQRTPPLHSTYSLPGNGYLLCPLSVPTAQQAPLLFPPCSPPDNEHTLLHPAEQRPQLFPFVPRQTMPPLHPDPLYIPSLIGHPATFPLPPAEPRTPSPLSLNETQALLRLPLTPFCPSAYPSPPPADATQSKISPTLLFLLRFLLHIRFFGLILFSVKNTKHTYLH